MTDAPILVTGAAGFIGAALAQRLLDEGRSVFGIDNLNDYYDPGLKQARLAALAGNPRFQFARLDIADRDAMAALFAAHRFAQVVHLAAQVGVRYSLVDPHAYAQANLVGFLNVLEGCRATKCRHLLYASSSSVYGGNTRLPFRTSDSVDHPLSLYGASKKANELMAHAYAHLFDIPATGLRFFTVYGPAGRPDMAIWLFTEAIMRRKPLRLFNQGRMRRDFTYIDDVVEALARLIEHPPAGDPRWPGAAPDPATSSAPWRVYNIGNHTPVEITEVVRLIENELGIEAVRELLPMEAGDVVETCADVADLAAVVGFAPATPIGEGIARFVAWYRGYVDRRASQV